jgi:hypothetical protein
MPVEPIHFRNDFRPNRLLRCAARGSALLEEILQCQRKSCFNGETTMRNTSGVGEVSRWQIIAALTRRGRQLLLPVGDHHRYDLAIDDEGTLLRIQCKTGRLRNGVVQFATCSVDSRSKQGGCVRRGYQGEVEFFGVYCPHNDKCYLVPVAKAPRFQCNLRIDPPRNGQKTRLIWAENYEIK